jgi:hypothetical protein
MRLFRRRRDAMEIWLETTSATTDEPMYGGSGG